ncbi:hypothetical protein OSSY52_19560 [Tepiditoga spiralis]|uniref:Glycosyl hydrolase n=1 Tax=Tepiditoga spiralis TaxID=2108365 RepID=A0A7G1G6L3_9BACT|nr:glycoside hydrolase [Tepiditoga spiralis]BBE31815.1 hypothetical protein OSSY52_19560 [Tepiditoga spiralis]
MKKTILFFFLLISAFVFSKVYILQNSHLKFSINTNNMEITAEKNGNYEIISSGKTNFIPQKLLVSKNKLSFETKNEKIIFELKDSYLSVLIEANKVETYEFLKLNGNAYTLPMQEGKYIPAYDSDWIKFLDGNIEKGSEFLSMQFLASNYKNFSSLFIIENIFNNNIKFYNENKKLKISVSHDFTSLNIKDKLQYRIYILENSSEKIAKTYKKYILEKNKFISLNKKIENNKNIKKMFGAPHIYLWSDEILIPQNIKNWKLFKQKVKDDLNSKDYNLTKHLLNIFKKNKIEDSKEALNNFNLLLKEKWIYTYLKNTICTSINKALYLRDFYNDKLSKYMNEEVKNINSMSLTQIYKINKEILYNAYKEYLYPIKNWGNGASDYILNELWNSGIKKAWFGLSDWKTGIMNSEFIKNAVDKGYVIGTYDSYHSIHEPGKELWNTAKFEDKTLYYKATIQNKEGKYLTGFLKKGRKLNPTLALNAVKNRVDKILNTGVKFNSWFLDCDGAGEFFEDYAHNTSEKMDMDARLKRIDLLSKKGLIVGTEKGNDYSSKNIIFSHGMESFVMDWSDKDLRKNQKSKYYLGKYWAAIGTPFRYSKEVPLKPIHKKIYYNQKYNLPLFQLVYHDSVISSYHWEMGSLKAPEEDINNMLREMLYCIPPLYHLDRVLWKKYKNTIINHINVWSKLHKKLANVEMTNFKILSNDKLVQMTEFKDKTKIIANFSLKNYIYKDTKIPPKSVLLCIENNKVLYSPKLYF